MVLPAHPPTPVFDAPAEVARLLQLAVTLSASDLHMEPDTTEYAAKLRIDGVLSPVQTYDLPTGQTVVARLMVLAKLLTYRLDVPQEGRLKWNETLDLRLSIMPTAKGLRAVVRLPAELFAPRSLDSLGLPPSVLTSLKAFCQGPPGLLLVTGPAGAGKTTLLYALLEHLRDASAGLSIITLEDPVERLLPGVTQIEVTPFGQLTYERALRSMLRQDPQVLMLGEVRDAATAQLSVQAALTGHRMLCTLHADDPASAIRRLLDMGIEPHQITSSLRGVVSVRLLRRKTETGYKGRVPVAEFVGLDDALRKAILANADASALRNLYESRPGHLKLRESALNLVESKITDLDEVARVLGGEKADNL